MGSFLGRADPNQWLQSNQIFAFAANKKGSDTQIPESLLINYLHVVGVAEGTRTPDIWNHNPVL